MDTVMDTSKELRIARQLFIGESTRKTVCNREAKNEADSTRDLQICFDTNGVGNCFNVRVVFQRAGCDRT